MRSDMSEVIIERPRINCARGGRLKGRRAELARIHPELSPRTEPMSIGRGTKYLNENLAPLRRFLERCVGRPWSSVRSEMCAHIAVTSAVQKHILDHVKEMVEVNPLMIDGLPHEPTASGSQRDRYNPLTYGRWRGFYVCPRTGILRKAPPRARDVKPRPDEPRDLGEMAEARKIDGIWYAITFAKVPTALDEQRDCYDILLKGRLSERRMFDWSGGLRKMYGSTERYAIAKRQLSTRELRAHGLT